MSHHAARPSHRSAVNVTPMIDVMLVLLIIFMIVTPLMHSRTILPKSLHADSRPEEPQDITLSIDRQGTWFLAAAPQAGPVALTPQRAAARLSALYRDRTIDRILYLKADAGLDFSRVTQAIGIARRAGVRVIATVTEQRPTGSPSGTRQPGGRTTAMPAP